MRLFYKGPDGGPESNVQGYFLCEVKSLFSIVLLYFPTGTREAYHSHAFNAVTLWLSGVVIEWQRFGRAKVYHAGQLKYTPRCMFHKIEACKPTWALSLRGPWSRTWQEDKAGVVTTLTKGRKIERS
jgi:quercetin dioxygenase-like cupin family protein